MADPSTEPLFRHPYLAAARKGSSARAAPRRYGTRVLVASLLAAGATGAWAQQEPPVVVDRTGADQVRAGQRFQYQLEVRNQSDVPVKDVHVDEFVPPSGNQQQQQQGGGQAGQQGQQQGQQQTSQQGQQQTSQQGQQQANQQGQQQGQQSQRKSSQQGEQDGEYGVNRTIPFLAPGQSQTITVSGVARREGTLRSCVAVDYTPATCADIQVVKPDISLSCDMTRPDADLSEPDVYKGQDLGANTFYACDTVTLTCNVRNEGSGATKATKLDFDLPDGLQAADNGKQQTQIDPIDPQESQQVTLKLKAKQPGEYRLQPTLSTDRGDMTAQPISVRVIQPQLQLALQAPDKGYLDRPMSYTVNVRNPGDVTVPNTRLTIDPPEGLENLSFSSENGTEDEGSFSIGALRPGQSRSVSVTGNAVDPGTANLRASASGYCAESQEKTAQVQLQGVPALVLVAYDERDPVAVGNRTSYDIKVRNQGTAPADKVKLSGKLGDQLGFVEGNGRTKVTGSGTSFNLAPIEQLKPGETAAWNITVEGKNAGYSQLDLELTSSATKRTMTDQEPTRVIQ